MCKFHSAFLTQSGEVYMCGQGRGGRLGLGHEHVTIEPQRISLECEVAMVAAAVDHTIFLASSGQVGFISFKTFFDLLKILLDYSTPIVT